MTFGLYPDIVERGTCARCHGPVLSTQSSSSTGHTIHHAAGTCRSIWPDRITADELIQRVDEGILDVFIHDGEGADMYELREIAVADLAHIGQGEDTYALTGKAWDDDFSDYEDGYYSDMHEAVKRGLAPPLMLLEDLRLRDGYHRLSIARAADIHHVMAYVRKQDT